MKIKINKPDLKKLIKDLFSIRIKKDFILNVISLLKKELRYYLSSPTIYIITILFLVISYLFFTGSFFITNVASLNALFDFMPWIFVFTVPALGMNLYASERKDGTIEYLFTSPITNNQIIIGKLLSTIFLSTIPLLFTLPLAISISFFGELDFGIVIGQYLASISLIISLSIISSIISILFKNQIAVYLSSAVVSFILLIIGTEFFAQSLGLGNLYILENISLFSHYTEISRGTISVRNILYLASFILVGFSLTKLFLTSLRYSPKSSQVKINRITVFLLLVLCGLIVQFASNISFRIDISTNQLYSLTQSTKDILNKLNQKVELNLFATTDLPPQIQPTFRDIEFLLKEYKNINQNVSYTINRFSENDDVNDVLSKGIEQVQFSISEGNELSIKNGFLGLEIKLINTVINEGEVIAENEGSTKPEDKTYVIPFIQNTDRMELDITSAIYKLADIQKPKITFIGNTESTYTTYISALKEQFDVNEISFNEGTVAEINLDPKELKALVIVGMKNQLTEDFKTLVKEYVKNGGNLLLAEDSFSISSTDNKTISAVYRDDSLIDLFSEYGVKIEKNVVFDEVSSEKASLSQGIFTTLINYPFWPVNLVVSKDNKFTKGINDILMPWTSEVTFETNRDDIIVNPLLTTSRIAGVLTTNPNINLDSNTKNDVTGSKITAVNLLLNKDKTDSSNVVILGTSNLFNDQFITYKQNLGFGLNIVEKLANEDSLASIQIKTRTAPLLKFRDNNDVILIKFGVPSITIFSILAISFIVYRNRKNKIKKVFED